MLQIEEILCAAQIVLNKGAFMLHIEDNLYMG
jgi:hypothetical protein